MIIMKNWYVAAIGDEFLAPELRPKVLCGNIYNNPKFTDGTYVTTSTIRSITNTKNCEGYKQIKTKNTVYTIYKEDVNKDYERTFPNAFERLHFIGNIDEEGV